MDLGPTKKSTAWNIISIYNKTTLQQSWNNIITAQTQEYEKTMMTHIEM